MDMIIKNIDLFTRKNEFTKNQKNKVKSFKEIYKQHSIYDWDDYKDGFNSIGDFFKKIVDDTPEIRKGLIRWVKSHKKELGYKKFESSSYNFDNTLIQVDTLDDYNKLMHFLEKLGYQWSNKLPTEKNFFGEYEQLCINVSHKKLSYGSRRFYLQEEVFMDYKIINFKDLNISKITRIENPDQDPYGEEDWGFTIED